MPADVSLAIEFLGFVVAAALVAYGVWRLRLELLLAGAAVAGLVWLTAACSTDDEWTTHELIKVRLQPTDAVSGAAVHGVTVEVIEPAEMTAPAVYRLPSVSERQAPNLLVVSTVVEVRVTGSLFQQHRRPAAQVEMVNQRLRLSAPGYRPSEVGLKELLPDGWPVTPTPDTPIIVEMQPE